MSVDVVGPSVFVPAWALWVIFGIVVIFGVVGAWLCVDLFFRLTMMHRAGQGCFVCRIAGIRTEVTYQVGPWYFRRFVCKDHGEAFDGPEGAAAEAEIRAEGGIG